jgi:hypothetical protein
VTSVSRSDRAEVLARLDVFVGTWAVEAIFPTDPTSMSPAAAGSPADDNRTGPHGRAVFDWILGERYLVQRTDVPAPEAPDGLAIVCVNPDADSYTQHYYDSRGVTRLYAMSFTEGVWRLVRNAPDFSPLTLHQRYTGTFSDDQDAIRGAWEKSFDGSIWEHDFALNYLRLA